VCGAGKVICLEQGADLHMAQLMPLPLTVSCFSKIQIGFSPRKRAVKRVCVLVIRTGVWVNVSFGTSHMGSPRQRIVKQFVCIYTIKNFSINIYHCILLVSTLPYAG